MNMKNVNDRYGLAFVNFSYLNLVCTGHNCLFIYGYKSINCYCIMLKFMFVI